VTEYGAPCEEAQPAPANPVKPPTTKEQYIACAKVGAAVGVLYFAARRALKVLAAMGKTGSLWNTKLSELMGVDKDILVGIELICRILEGAAASAGQNVYCKFMPSTIVGMTFGAFWQMYIAPVIKECGLADLPADIGTIISPPPLWMPNPSDVPGIRTGRYCYDVNKQQLWTLGWKNCLRNCQSCCDTHLTTTNKMIEERTGCYAVCTAGLTPYNPWNK
jgi:hypothetical protein